MPGARVSTIGVDLLLRSAFFALAIVLAGASTFEVLPFALGVAAAVPLVALGRWHHLPARAGALLGFVPKATAMTLVIVVGMTHAVEAFTIASFASVGVVLARQWWLTHHPLPRPEPLDQNSLVAVIVPAHNEIETIADVVARIPRDGNVRVIVVDDGSNDGSGAAALAAGADEVVGHPSRRGLGAALRTGLLTARTMGAAAAVYLDADGEYDPADLPAVLQPVIRGEADYVLGNRFPIARTVMRPARHCGNRAFSWLVSTLAGRWIADGQTGFRAFGPRALACAEIIHDYNYAQVLTLDLLRKQMRLAEVPIGYRVRTKGRSFIRYHEYARRVVPAMVREILAP
jgi:hypothetical protein